MKKTCDVCLKNDPVGVANALGPVSIAYCASCLARDVYPWWNIVGYLGGIRPENLVPEAQETLRVNLEFHNKTQEDLDSDFTAMMLSYQTLMASEEPTNEIETEPSGSDTPQGPG